MKKSVKKLKLYRETVSLLDTPALAEAAGAALTWDCLSSPHRCFLTGFQNTCEI
jgi:hypothetical protein